MDGLALERPLYFFMMDFLDGFFSKKTIDFTKIQERAEKGTFEKILEESLTCYLFVESCKDLQETWDFQQLADLMTNILAAEVNCYYILLFSEESDANFTIRDTVLDYKGYYSSDRLPGLFFERFNAVFNNGRLMNSKYRENFQEKQSFESFFTHALAKISFHPSKFLSFYVKAERTLIFVTKTLLKWKQLKEKKKPVVLSDIKKRMVQLQKARFYGN